MGRSGCYCCGLRTRATERSFAGRRVCAPCADLLSTRKLVPRPHLSLSRKEGLADRRTERAGREARRQLDWLSEEWAARRSASAGAPAGAQKERER